MAMESIRVIGAAMTEAGTVGIARLTMSRRERMVMVESCGSGMVLITLRAADEVRGPQFMKADDATDADMLAIARTLIERRIEKFDVNEFRDRYQEALQELIETKVRGLAIKPRAVVTPAPVTDLMAALKRSLGDETLGAKVAEAKKRAKAPPHRRQGSLLLPVPGGRKKNEELATEPTTIAAKGT
jgi:DNA end-binding protein Ku